MRTILTALLVAIVPTVSAEPVKTNELRRLAKLPTNTVQAFIGISSLESYLDQMPAAEAAKPSRNETQLRAVLQTNPRDATAWCELGNSLLHRAMSNHLHLAEINLADIAKVVRDVQEGRLTENDIRAAEQLTDESLDCFGKAIAAAPDEVRGYLYRALFRMLLRTYFHAARNALTGQQQPGMMLMFGDDIIADLREAARLRPDDSKAQEIVVVWQIMSVMFANPRAFSMEKGIGAQVTGPVRQSIRENVVRLETLASSTNRATVAGANNALGCIAFLLTGPSEEAVKRLHAAVAADPTLERAWELLSGALVSKEQFDQLALVSAERLRAADTPRNRFIFAKALERLNQFDKAEEQLDLILKRHPNDFAAIVGKAALALRDGRDKVAVQFLSRADALSNDATDRTQRADFHTLQAILAALRGQRNEAERYLGFAFRLDENNKNARAVLRSIGF